MKIYTEVNYEFKDGSLVEQSSKFYNYDGQVAECKSSGEDIKKDVQKEVETAITKPQESAYVNPMVSTTETLRIGKQQIEETGIGDTIREGPGGTAKHWVDQIYGGSTKDAVESVQQTYRDAEGGYHNILQNQLGQTDEDTPTDDGTILTTPEEREDILQQGKVAKGGREAKFGRTAMIEAKDKASILAPKR